MDVGPLKEQDAKPTEPESANENPSTLVSSIHSSSPSSRTPSICSSIPTSPLSPYHPTVQDRTERYITISLHQTSPQDVQEDSEGREDRESLENKEHLLYFSEGSPQKTELNQSEFYAQFPVGYRIQGDEEIDQFIKFDSESEEQDDNVKFL